MFTSKFFAISIVAFGSMGAVYAVPATAAANCPSTTTVTTSYTGLIEAPGTTYPYTTTVTLTEVSYPLTTSTEIGTWTYDGETSTYTDIFTSTNYYGPFPGC